MKKYIFIQAVVGTLLLAAAPVYAQSGDIVKVQSFIQSIIQVLVTLAGLVSTGFFVWGGLGYITSSGDPESLDRSKKTIVYSAIGLVIVLAAFVISNIVTDLATGSFGAPSN